MKTFGWSFTTTAVALIVVFIYGGMEAFIPCAILGSLRFCNAAPRLRATFAVLTAGITTRRPGHNARVGLRGRGLKHFILA